MFKLDRNMSRRFTCLSTWYSVDVSVWERLGGMVLEEVFHLIRLWGGEDFWDFQCVFSLSASQL